jgi:tRNA modification GTPase
LWLREEHSHPLDADAAAALLEAPTVRTAQVLLEQTQGAWPRQLALWRDRLQRQETQELLREIECCLGFQAFGAHLTAAWRVALIGPANVGKSSLMNRLLGYDRSIVFHEPGTTRDVVAARTALDGWPVEFSDTAGLRDAADVQELERAGMQRTLGQTASADLMLLVGEPAQLSACQALEQIAGRAGPRPVLRVMNKCDLWPAATPVLENWLPTSALTGEGLSELAGALCGALVPAVPRPGAAIPFLPAHRRFLGDLLHEVATGDLPAADKRLERVLLSGLQEGQVS